LIGGQGVKYRFFFEVSFGRSRRCGGLRPVVGKAQKNEADNLPIVEVACFV
jgi:hypothetical protein